MAGANPATNLRPGPDSSGNFARRDFSAAPANPTNTASTASASQIASQRDPCCRDAIHAAASAVDPISIPPIPGTAVKDPARSMVSRMYRRLSMACAWSAIGSGRVAAMLIIISGIEELFKYFPVQRSTA